jgi:hypothetical protein
MVLGDSTLWSLTPSVNAPLTIYIDGSYIASGRGKWEGLKREISKVEPWELDCGSE